MVLRGEITKEKLTAIYDTINRIIENQNCYYKEDEVEKIRENQNNIFLKNSNIRN